eukprot:2871051-Pyramimonas_sp.AAC.1
MQQSCEGREGMPSACTNHVRGVGRHPSVCLCAERRFSKRWSNTERDGQTLKEMVKRRARNTKQALFLGTAEA